ncbi:hypothetical protein H671_6g15323 [Cricetulus griseus]|nr:hypothetical protein H671_6g15323 [Cricetulus griseus]
MQWRSVYVMFTSQLSLMLYGPIVKVPRGLFPSHAEWTFCQNVPATVAPAAYKHEFQMYRTAKLLSEYQGVEVEEEEEEEERQKLRQ